MINMLLSISSNNIHRYKNYLLKPLSPSSSLYNVMAARGHRVAPKCLEATRATKVFNIGDKRL